jgi:deoxyribonuclease V
MLIPESMHEWHMDYREAVELQQRLVSRLKEKTIPIAQVNTIAGVDVSSSRGSDLVHAAAVVLDFETLETVDKAVASVKTNFPYIPGLLSFREGPAALSAIDELSIKPDIVIFDGQGYAHPRRLGLAAHIGLWLEVPTIGCAKSRLVGQFDPPGDTRGSLSLLCDGDKEIGAVLRTRTGVKPVFVSRGHLCDLPSAVAVVFATAVKFRLPEPIRSAHLLCNQARRNYVEVKNN